VLIFVFYRRSTANIPYDSQSCLVSPSSALIPSADIFFFDSLLFEPRNDRRRFNFWKNDADGTRVCEEIQWPSDGVKEWASKVDEAIGLVEEPQEQALRDEGQISPEAKGEAKGQREDQAVQQPQDLDGPETAQDYADEQEWPEAESEQARRQDAEHGEDDWDDGVVWAFETPPPSSTFQGNVTEVEEEQGHTIFDKETIARFNRAAHQANVASINQSLAERFDEYEWEHPDVASNSFGQAAERLIESITPRQLPLLLPFPTSQIRLSDGSSHNAALTRALTSRPPSFRSVRSSTMSEGTIDSIEESPLEDPEEEAPPPLPPKDLPEPDLCPKIRTKPLPSLPAEEPEKRWWEQGFRRLRGERPRKNRTQISSANISWPLERDDDNEQKDAVPPGVDQTRVSSPRSPSLPEGKGGRLFRTLKALGLRKRS
jgi:hypothetical protein